ncbi:MAG: fibronectin type III domain-containing protein [Sporocytophaga sp.]|uniref:fibronectin type III domain-containing protein n=1 Tax=Sporocytophaga sp. TaxID=2231183 RepID=UPI001B174640|nr:fibronectin type III domain-containing protein [Sporocytophaga sp.]MBO9701851.1 fibronectin type III domain-containing protein [Sporocytophaga sp.]
MTTSKKAKVKLNLKGSSIEEKLILARQIVQALTANEHFPTPFPSLEIVGSTIGELDKAFAEVKQARQTVSTRLSILEDKSSEFDSVMNQLAAYVESTAKGDEVKIKLAGMNVKAPKTPSAIPSAPVNLQAVAANEKEIELSWESVKGAKSYVVQLTSDLSKDDSWSVAIISTKARATIKNLESGKKYWFKVAAIASAGQSAWSHPATKYAI